jgi:hypothetical protein
MRSTGYSLREERVAAFRTGKVFRPPVRPPRSAEHDQPVRTEPACGRGSAGVTSRKLMKPSLVGRLMLAYTAVLVAVLVSAWWSDRSFSEENAAAQRLSQRSVEGIELTAELEKLLQDKSALDDSLLSGDRSTLAAIQPDRRSFQSWLERMGEFARTDDERRLLDQIRIGHAAYTESAEEVLRLQGEGRIDDARRALVALGTGVEQLLANSQRLLQLTEADMQQRRARAEASLAGARGIVLWTTIFGAFCSLVLGFILTRHVRSTSSCCGSDLPESSIASRSTATRSACSSNRSARC